MAKSRKDNKGRVLRKGEGYRPEEKRYHYTYVDPRGKRRYIYSTDLAKLREREQEIKRDQMEGIDNYVAGHITVNEVFDRCMAVKTNLRRTTRANYELMYNKHVRHGFGERVIGSIKYSDVKLFYHQMVTEDGIKPNTIATIHSCLHQTFEMAFRDDVIRKNPCHGVLRELSNDLGKNAGIRNALTIEQQNAFMDYIDGHEIYDHWWPIFSILLGTGCRCGEFIGLRWQDIDMEKRTINVNHALVRVKRHRGDPARRLGVSLPKTDAGIRIIPMLDDVYDSFKRVYEEQLVTGFNETVIEGMSGFIFKNANGDVLCEQNLNSAIKRIGASYNMEEEVKAAKEKREPLLLPNFSVHYLRHTFCTRFCENENRTKVIQTVMGHKNIRTTMDVYAEATDNVVQEAMQDFSAKWKEFSGRNSKKEASV